MGEQAAPAARLTLREIITLADQAPGMIDTEVRAKLRLLADVAARGCR